jgi:hypothetical protein
MTEGVEKRIHFKMRIGERVDGDFEIRFKGGTVGADIIFDGKNIGRGHS